MEAEAGAALRGPLKNFKDTENRAHSKAFCIFEVKINRFYHLFLKYSSFPQLTSSVLSLLHELESRGSWMGRPDSFH